MTAIKTIDDLSVATDYIQRKLLSDTWPNGGTHNAAKTDFPEPLDNAVLSAWCQQWLSDDQRQKLAAAIRSARKRRRNPNTRTVTLTASAHSKLARVARREAVTLSEVVERCLK